MTDSIRKIVFIGYGLLGDFVICLKSIELLRVQYPEAYIYYIGNKTFAQLGLDGYHINKIVEEDDEFINYYTQKNFISTKWEKLLSKANLLITQPMDMEGVFADKMKKMGFVHQTTPIRNFKIRDTKTLLNTIFFYGDVKKDETTSAYIMAGKKLKNINIDTDYWIPSLRLPSEEIMYAEKLVKRLCIRNEKGKQTNKIIAFHPGASIKEKCMPIRQWQRVFEKILDKEDYLIVITGPSEKNILIDIKKTLKQHKTFYINNKNLKTTSAILKQCNLFLGHDTGFAHIAAALNVPSVLVCGPLTLLDVWVPPTLRTKAIQFDSIDKIDISLVAQVIGERMQNLV